VTPGDFPDLVDVVVRYSDLGPDGRVTTAALARWFEDTRISGIAGPYSRLVDDGGYGSLRILLATLEVERLAEVRLDAPTRVGIGVRRIGRTSFTYGYGVFSGDDLVGAGETVTVLADDDGAAPLPGELRADLERTLLDDDGTPSAPRPGEERYARGSYPFAVTLRARLADLDTNRHVNNVTLLDWYGEAISALAVEALDSAWGGPPPALAPRMLRIRFVAEVGYPADHEIALAVTGFDDEVVHYELGLFRGGECVGLAEATGVRGDLPDDVLVKYGR
jgi:acyl-CoA thioester hydrolase